ncbi:MAG TPA: Asp-tRNA(Asn)/Glu-tRNA(Gln) amidotransferase subunit GatB [Lacunisphaera sp.]
MKYEAVIGLEVHVQLRTASKMFTRVAAGYGEPENTLVDPVVLALPGALPVMNKEALDKIIKAGLILGCEIAPICKWDRKNYFYPDSPKNYQISQYDQPICLGGAVEIELPGPSRNVMGEHKKIPLTRIHLEEDVGKLNHGAGESLVDYNRAGTPLMEIVSDPAMHSADEAFAFLTSLRIALVQGGISDCDMEKGQMRCDANISIRPVGETKLGTKVELKNLNSISFVRDGIAHEIRRQIAVKDSGGTIVQETRDYDGQTGASQSLRSKEMAHDYRYFPDPDLMPVEVKPEWKEAIRATIPEHHFDRQRRYMRDFGAPYSLTSALISDLEACRVYEETQREGLLLRPKLPEVQRDPALDPVLYQKYFGHAPGAVAPDQPKLPTYMAASGNFVVNEFMRIQGMPDVQIKNPALVPLQIAGLILQVENGVVSNTTAKSIFPEMIKSGEMPDAMVERNQGLKQSTDTGELEQWVSAAIAADPKAAAGFKAGNEKALNAIKGAVMKASKGKANPQLVDQIVRKQLG